MHKNHIDKDYMIACSQMGRIKFAWGIMKLEFPNLASILSLKKFS